MNNYHKKYMLVKGKVIFEINWILHETIFFYYFALSKEIQFLYVIKAKQKKRFK